eukprot:scaffold222481_cov36-Cyclotella_meneghiniana.AAC.1
MAKTIKKKLRIEMKPKSSKGKTKPLTLIIWDGMGLRIPCPLENNDEYTLDELRNMKEGTIIVGSTEPASQRSAPSAPVDDASGAGNDVELLSSQLQNGLLLSKHARDRMHERKITEDQLLKCYHEGTRCKQSDGTTLHRNSMMEIIVSGKTVMTAIAIIKESYPFPSGRALALRKAGIFQAIRDELDIRVSYDEQTKTFQLEGHDDGIRRAKHRLEKLSENNETTIRIPSNNDICGRVIGSRGVMIEEIKEKCGIKSLSVQWEEESKEIILSSPFYISEVGTARLHILIDDVIHQRSLSIFNDEEIESVNMHTKEKKADKRSKSKLVRDAYEAEGEFHLNRSTFECKLNCAIGIKKPALEEVKTNLSIGILIRCQCHHKSPNDRWDKVYGGENGSYDIISDTTDDDYGGPIHCR